MPSANEHTKRTAVGLLWRKLCRIIRGQGAGEGDRGKVTGGSGKRIVGLDIGQRRIGVAVSDPTRTLARPLGVLASTPDLPHTVGVIVAEIDRLAAEEDGVEGVVIGLPRRLDGSDNDMTPRVKALADALRARIGVPIALQDERLSSREAESRLAMREKDWRVRKQRLDAAAAAVILQDYLDGFGLTA